MSNDWKRFLPAIEAAYAPWMRDHGSLTARIQQRCKKFSVRNVCDSLRTATRDECRLIGTTSRHKVYTREVFLRADDLPVVFAHSVVAAQHLHGAWHALHTVGQRPLGPLLFAHPLVRRAPLHFKALTPEHPLYRRATATLAAPPRRLWARRSLFTLYGTPLLVTEVFLPDIMQLEIVGAVRIAA